MSTPKAAEPLSPAAGDELPPAAAAFFAAFGGGDLDAAVASFAADGLYAAPGEDPDETAPRRLGQGSELVAALESDPAFGSAHALRVCCAEDGDCLVEGTIAGPDGEPAQSFAASLQLDRTGLISRNLTFRCEATEDAAGTAMENPSGADAQAQLAAYFQELESGDFDAARAYFSEDCLYSHPPYSHGSPRVEFRGHEQLLAGFERRGNQPKQHFVPVAIQRGPHLMVEGHVWLDGSTPDGGTESFVSCATLAPDGRVKRYLAYVCEPMVARR
jgi:ketosteroid isomerase-like protein